MEELNDLKIIVGNNRMSTRPEAYSGRGTSTSDLNSEILEGIYKGIQKKFGNKSADAFVKMVAGIKIPSASNFLDQLYQLQRNGWNYEEPKNEQHVPIQQLENGNYDMIHGMFSTALATMTTNKHDCTFEIINPFCEKHNVKPLYATKKRNGVIGME